MIRERLRKFGAWLRAALFTLLIHGGIVYLVIYGISFGQEKIKVAGRPVQAVVIKQEDLDLVALDMTRGQVRYLLGTPMVDDPFHADRWDYVYYLTIGRKDATFKRWVTIVFENDRVIEIRRDQELAPDL